MSETAQALTGGLSEPRAPTIEDQAILDEVEEQYEDQSGTSPEEFRVVLVSTQVVAGINYFFKVDIGEDAYIHARVFLSMPDTGEVPTLVSFQTDKKKDDKLEYF